MLFSEPKIPQSFRHLALSSEIKSFSALQRAENSSITGRTHIDVFIQRFQCSSASRKFLNDRHILLPPSSKPVSVLFSEPKIPQFLHRRVYPNLGKLFQCSSASRKFLNPVDRDRQLDDFVFQCSSASRKFLNHYHSSSRRRRHRRFSALQRAENSSMFKWGGVETNNVGFSALQRAENSSISPSPPPNACSLHVSVLFSEPKIPQSARRPPARCSRRCFSALQRAENSSIERSPRTSRSAAVVSVLFSEPKIPQSSGVYIAQLVSAGFSALQRAENSSIQTLAPASIHISDRDDHTSSFLSLPGASP